MKASDKEQNSGENVSSVGVWTCSVRRITYGQVHNLAGTGKDFKCEIAQQVREVQKNVGATGLGKWVSARLHCTCSVGRIIR